jgi:ABC-type transport system substrate-binding protein
MADGNNNNKTRRRFLQATGGTAAALALAGCLGGGGDGGSGQNNSNGSGGNNQSGGGNQSGGNQSDKPQPKKGGPGKTDRIVQDTNSTMTTLDPIHSTDEASGIVGINIFDALINYPNGRTNVEPLLIKDYKKSSDAKTYTFTLKDEPTFSNGKDVTAQDVIYSWERLAASENSKRKGFILENLGVKHETITKNGSEVYKPKSMAVKALDKKTVQMKIVKPTPVVLEILAYNAFAIVPEGIVGDIKGYQGKMSYQEFSKKNPIGAGPYTLKAWKSGSYAEVEARDDYYGKGPMNGGVHWQIIKSSNAMYTYSVLNTNADFPVVPTAKYNPKLESKQGENENGYEYGTYGPMKNGLKADYYRIEELSTFYYGFNMNNVPKPVRKAVAHIANPQLLVDKIYKTPRVPAAHFTPPKIWPTGRKGYFDHAKKYPYGRKSSNIDKAKQLMKKAGYGPNNPFKFTMLSYTSSRQQRILRLLRSKLRAANIQMQIKTTPFSTLVERAYSGQTDAFTLGWIADWPYPPNFLKLLYPPATDTSSGENVSGFNWSSKNGSAAKDAKQAWQTIQSHPKPKKGKKERTKAIINMEEAMWEDVPMVPTTHTIFQHEEYPWVYKPRAGGMGSARQKENRTEIGKRKK